VSWDEDYWQKVANSNGGTRVEKTIKVTVLLKLMLVAVLAMIFAHGNVGTKRCADGTLIPIGYDKERIQLEDIVRQLDLPSVMVADAGLGTINGVVLTYEYMKQKKMPLKGIIFNNFHSGDVMKEDNLP